MNLAEWAEAQHIHPQTAYRWFRAGKLPKPAQRVGGLIMVGDLTDTQPEPGEARTEPGDRGGTPRRGAV